MKTKLQESRDELSMNWSEDIPEVQSLPTSYVSPAGENMLSPHALLHNRDMRGKRRATHVGLMLYSWSFRVGCTVASTDHG